MSLRQKFSVFFGLKTNQKQEFASFKPAIFSTSSIPEFQSKSIKEHFWLAIFAVTLVLWLVPALFLIPKLYDFASATTWSIIEDIDTTGGQTGYGIALTMDASNYPAVVYGDWGNSNIKYASRSTGSWVTENIQTSVGLLDATNEKFAVGIDPDDDLVSAAYRTNIAGTLSVRYAHRVGGGTGNCGTSNNWSCQTAFSTSTSNGNILKISMAFHTTSSKPTLAFVEKRSSASATGGYLDYTEYDGASWTKTQIVNSAGLYNIDHAVLDWSPVSNTPAIVYRDGTELKFAYRLTNGTWTIHPSAIDGTLPSLPTSVHSSLTHDSSGVFYVAYTTASGLMYGSQNANGTWTTSTVATVTASYPWIAYNSTGAHLGIAYADTTNGMRYANNNGGPWSAETVSSTNVDTARAATNLTFFGGSPVIAYKDSNHHAVFMSAASSFGNSAPTAPTTPYSNSSTAQSGETNPTNLATGTPAFSALFQDSDVGNTGAKAEIQVTTSTNGFATITHWDSGSSGTAITSVAIGARSQDMIYNAFGSAATQSIGINDDTVEGANTTYYWRIRFWDNNGATGAYSATQTFSILDKPLAPSGVSAAFGTTTSSISWTDNSSVEDFYEVLVSTNGTSYSHAASTTGASQTATSTTGLTPNTQYYYTARGYNAAGYSATTTAASGYTLANIPTGLTATSSDYDRVQLVWNANSNPVTTEYYALNVTDATNSGWNTGTAYTFTGLQGAKSYTFQVKARNASATETEYTTVVSTTTLPNVPSGLTVTQNGTSAAASWSANGNSASAQYNVENTTAGTESGWQTGLTYAFSNLLFDIPYQFRVRARNSDGIVSSYTSTVILTLVASGANAGSQQAIIDEELQKQLDDPIIVSFKINNGAEYAITSHVNIAVSASSNISLMKISNEPSFQYTNWEPLKTSFSWDLIPGDGPRTVYMQFQTQKGNEGDTYAASITVDSGLPEPPIIIDPIQNSTLFDTQPMISGVSESGTRVYLLLRPQRAAEPDEMYATVTSLGAWSVQWSRRMGFGLKTITAVAIDKAGNKSPPVSVAFTISDSTPPQAPIIQSLEDGATITSSMPIITGTAEPGSTIVIVRDGFITYETITNELGEWYFKIPVPFGDGPHTLEFTTYDEANNQSEKVVIHFTVLAVDLIIPPPEIALIECDGVLVAESEGCPSIEKKERERLRKVNVVNCGNGVFVDEGESCPVSTSKTEEQIAKEEHAKEIEKTPESITEEIVTIIEKQAEGAVVPLAEFISKATLEDLSKLSPIGILATVQAPAAKSMVLQLQKIAKTVARIAVVINEIRKNPTVQTVNKTVVAPVTATAAVAVVTTVAQTGQLVLYFQYLFTQPFVLLRRKKRAGWGMTYDSLKRLPIDLALVRLVDSKQNRIVQSRVTDIHGRYQFFVQRGEYKIEVVKPNYIFPSSFRAGEAEDASFTNVYTGGSIEKAEPSTITRNLPMDPVGAEKPANQILKERAKFYAINAISVSGIAVTAISFVVSPTPIMGAFLCGHIASYALFARLAKPRKPKHYATVVDATTREPLSRAIVRIFDTQYDKLLETQVTDAKGHYGFLVGKNSYYLVVEKEGKERFVSEPIVIDKDEGATIAVDITLKPAVVSSSAQSSSVVPEVSISDAADASVAQKKQSAQPPMYIPKEQIKENAATVNLKKKSAEFASVAELPSSAIADTEKQPQNTQKEIKQKDRVISLGGAAFAARLLGNASGGSRDMIIYNAPSIAPEISRQFVREGNFLHALDEKDRSPHEHVVTNHGGDLLAAVKTVEKRLHG